MLPKESNLVFQFLLETDVQLDQKLNAIEPKSEHEAPSTASKVAKVFRTVLLATIDSHVGGRASDIMENILDKFQEKDLEGVDVNKMKEEMSSNRVKYLNAQIQSRIESYLQAYKTYRQDTENTCDRMVFFIDDLDRLKPEQAVEFLEGLKNAMNCRNCVYVLAIDFEVVKRGMSVKYGQNMEEEKAVKFFDKIIQVPFELPVASYAYRNYLEEMLGGIVEDKRCIDKCIELQELIINRDVNPRGIKRSINLLRLNLSIQDKKEDGTQNDENRDRILLLTYAMILLQMYQDDQYDLIGKTLKFGEDPITLDQDSNQEGTVKQIQTICGYGENETEIWKGNLDKIFSSSNKHVELDIGHVLQLADRILKDVFSIEGVSLKDQQLTDDNACRLGEVWLGEDKKVAMLSAKNTSLNITFYNYSQGKWPDNLQTEKRGESFMILDTNTANKCWRTIAHITSLREDLLNHMRECLKIAVGEDGDKEKLHFEAEQ